MDQMASEILSRLVLTPARRQSPSTNIRGIKRERARRTHVLWWGESQCLPVPLWESAVSGVGLPRCIVHVPCIVSDPHEGFTACRIDGLSYPATGAREHSGISRAVPLTASTPGSGLKWQLMCSLFLISRELRSRSNPFRHGSDVTSARLHARSSPGSLTSA